MNCPNPSCKERVAKPTAEGLAVFTRHKVVVRPNGNLVATCPRCKTEVEIKPQAA